MKTFILSLLVSIFMMGCGDDTLPKYSSLGALRVLAITSTTPEVLGGSGTVNVVPYVSDVNGAGRALNYDAEACLHPTLGYGAEPTCTGNVTRQVIATGASVSGGLLTAGNGYTGSVDTLTANVPSMILLSVLDDVTQYNGIPLLIVFRVYAASGESVRSFRRIMVTTDTSKVLNSNPALTDILSNGSAIGTALPPGEVSLTPSYSAGAAETFSELGSDGAIKSLSETLVTTWFVSAGGMDKDRSFETRAAKFAAPGSVPSLGSVVLVGVLRDGRGGVSVVQRNLL